MQLTNNVKISDALSYFDNLPNSSNVRLPVVMVIYGISSASVWRNVKLGYIPKPRKLTPRTTVWNVGEIRHALHLKKGGSDE